MASRSLDVAKQKGVRVDEKVLAKVDQYTKDQMKPADRTRPIAAVLYGAMTAASPVPLYQSAQALEQMSRSAKARSENAPQIRDVVSSLDNAQFVRGFGSMGGEVVLLLSEHQRQPAPHRRAAMGEVDDVSRRSWRNCRPNDGTWAGHHSHWSWAVTGAAILHVSCG